MHARLPWLRTTAAAASLVTLAACGDRRAGDRAAADSALTRDLTLASAPTVQPTFQDTAVAPAPAAAKQRTKEPPRPVPIRHRTAPKPRVETPRPVEQHAPPPEPTPQPVAQMPAPVPAPIPAVAPARGEIGSGTGFSLTTGSKVCTSSNLPGDKIVATLNSAVTGTNGAVIPAGSSVVLEVASASAGQNGGSPQITFRVRSIVVNDQTYSVSGNVATLDSLQRTKVAGSDPNADKKKVIGGAIVGAILGQMIGHNTKGTVIGAAAGAAAGAAVAKSGEKWEGCLPAGAALRVTLAEPVVM